MTVRDDSHDRHHAGWQGRCDQIGRRKRFALAVVVDRSIGEERGLRRTMHRRAAEVPFVACGDLGAVGFKTIDFDLQRLAVIRRTVEADECRRAMGDEPHAFCWATGACMLYQRRAFETCGFFREDFWMLGEDLEFSMRVAAALGGVFTAQATVPHLPPPPDPDTSRVAHRLKFLALLQNLSYLAFHFLHSAHLKSYLPGNFKRYVRTEGLSPGTLWDGWCAFYQGALCRQPAGTPSGARLRERAARRLASP